MLATTFYKGSGTGNQLANYVAVRCLALDKGFEFGIYRPEQFKGSSFLNLDMGLPVVGGFYSIEGQKPEVLPLSIKHWYKEETSDYDPKFATTIEDNTLVHGLLQGVDYFKHRKDEVREWLKVEPLEVADDVCILNIRGGEYIGVLDFNLPKSYWDMAILEMKKENPNMRFVIHTDDYNYAKNLFPEYDVISDIGINWRTLRFAKYLILSNSSFAILPVYLNENVKRVIAPRFFARYNTGDWFLKQNWVEGWDYLDKDGKIYKK